jgi:hypothetical protein
MSESFSPELPARLVLAGQIKETHVRLVQEALAASSKITEDEKQSWTLTDEITNVGSEDREAKLDHAVPGDILGSDHVFVRDIIDAEATDQQDGLSQVGIDLFREGSPYVPDSDIDVADSSSYYMIFATPDAPPIAINIHLLVTETDRNNETYFDAAMRLKGSNPSNVHELSDDECKVILDGLSRFEVDMDEFESIAGAEV